MSDASSTILRNTRNLPTSVIPLLEQVARHPRVERIILFGSRAVGDHQERSDVDVALDGPTLRDADMADFRLHMEDGDTLFSVDLLRLDRVSTAVRQRIQEQGVILYERA